MAFRRLDVSPQCKSRAVNQGIPRTLEGQGSLENQYKLIVDSSVQPPWLRSRAAKLGRGRGWLRRRRSCGASRVVLDGCDPSAEDARQRFRHGRFAEVFTKLSHRRSFVSRGVRRIPFHRAPRRWRHAFLLRPCLLARLSSGAATGATAERWRRRSVPAGSS